MPETTGRSRRKLESAIDFYNNHSDKIHKEHPGILTALRYIQDPEHQSTLHPLRLHFWGQPGLRTPALGKLEDQHRKWFSHCKLDFAPAKESLEDLKRIQDRVSDLWLRTGADLATHDADPRIALEAAQSTLKHMPSEENITSYLHTMALLVYSTRKALEYSAHLLSLWVDIGRSHGGTLLEEKDTRQEILRCCAEFFNEQQAWPLLMSCPWTVAFALHLLADDSPEAMEHPERDDGEGNIRILSGNPARPPKFAAVFVAVDNTLVKCMLKSCFRLNTTKNEDKHLMWSVRPFINCADHGYKRSIHINFISDTSGHEIEESDVLQMIRQYWREQDTLKCRTLAEEGFLLLSQLADTRELLDDHLHMKFSRPKAHCECILAQHWMARRHLTNQLFPLIGTSSHTCQTCDSFLRAMLVHTNTLPTAHDQEFAESDALERMIPGTANAYRLCMVPEQSPTPVKEAVAGELMCRVRMQLRRNKVLHMLEEQVREASRGDIDSDSHRREFDGDSLAGTDLGTAGADEWEIMTHSGEDRDERSGVESEGDSGEDPDADSGGDSDD
ncbi:hypothetical protein KVR01_009727 [Diaporthe batatas]|uniref:uncharacterized protein n=1 Tax=Diaporthe batatas TaxID=748121 RepID=UPI001D051362|nr:uncharacterized protein KVR01_009727 [Diaporthe batatas]KAG8160191.1 hypothetical protein KVR01_009727 [Diaporthe batatas]